jgi:uncharacterized protein with PIN domain
MPKAVLRFYNELNDLLPEHRRNTEFEAEFKDKRSIKDMIESLGVPHTEVDIIIANENSVDFSYILLEGDRIHVYPASAEPDTKDTIHLRPSPFYTTRFIADTNLGNIARYMRVLGFDTYFDPALSTRAIIELSLRENRIIITKSRKLLKFKNVTYGLLLRPGTTEAQVKTILCCLGIKDSVKPFSRCLRCNGILISVPKNRIEARIPPKTRSFCNEYSHCESCDKIYWEGTHVFEIKKVINRLLEE